MSHYRKSISLSLMLGLSLLIASCSTGPNRKNESDAPPAKGSSTSLTDSAANQPGLAIDDSSIDISYKLGHNQHRFVIQALPNRITAQTFLDRRVLKESTIEKPRYADYLKKVHDFIASPRRATASLDGCRAPFTVKLRLGKETQSLNGCRGADEGALSRLVRDGEFLLFSRK